MKRPVQSHFGYQGKNNFQNFLCETLRNKKVVPQRTMEGTGGPQRGLSALYALCNSLLPRVFVTLC